MANKHLLNGVIKSEPKGWSDEEISKMLDLKKQGLSFDDIGKMFGRTAYSCNRKYYKMMKKLDAFEKEILDAYEKGELKSSSPSKAKLAKFKAAATATFLKEKRINIRLSTPDLMDIQARALEEGMPYQTLIASVLHKFVSGRLVEASSNRTTPTRQK